MFFKTQRIMFFFHYDQDVKLNVHIALVHTMEVKTTRTCHTVKKGFFYLMHLFGASQLPCPSSEKHHDEYLLLCSTEESKSYRFEMKSRVNDDRIIIFFRFHNP